VAKGPCGGTRQRVEQVATTESHADARFRFWAKVDGIPVRVIIDSESSRDSVCLREDASHTH
jgi:hypothetical protein